MQMDVKKPKGLLKDSIILLDIMTGEDKMYYLERMWNLYFRVYINSRRSRSKKLSKTFSMDKKKPMTCAPSLLKFLGIKLSLEIVNLKHLLNSDYSKLYLSRRWRMQLIYPVLKKKLTINMTRTDGL
jgi:hypothetical protein